MDEGSPPVIEFEYEGQQYRLTKATINQYQPRFGILSWAIAVHAKRFDLIPKVLAMGARMHTLSLIVAVEQSPLQVARLLLRHDEPFSPSTCRMLWRSSHGDDKARLLIDFGIYPDSKYREQFKAFVENMEVRERSKKHCIKVMLCIRHTAGMRSGIASTVGKHLWTLRWE